MSNAPDTKASPEAAQGNLRSYTIGFGLSLLLTLWAYWAVQRHSLSKEMLLAAILTLAIAQLVVQLVFFLHLGKGSKSRWNLTVLGFMLIVLGILVFGSLWIMRNLNYHMHDPAAHMTDQQIIQDEGVQPE